jgi:hypothetical protein
LFDIFKTKTDLSARKMLHCASCKRKTIHSLEAQCEGIWSDDMAGGGSRFSTYRCGACDTVCYETSSWDNNDYEHDDNGDIYVPEYSVQYPPPTSASFAFNTDYTPAGLDALISEMMYAFAGSKLILATVGLRMVIEFIVNDAKCPGKNLAAKIDALHDQGHIDERQKTLLHKIRQRGNAGAHESSPMGTSELVAGMGVVELLLEKIYNGPGRHKTLMQRAESAFKDDTEGNSSKDKS